MKKGLVFLTSLCAMALGLASCQSGGGGGQKYEVSITNKDAIAEIYEDDTTKSVSVKIEGVVTADAYQSGDLVVTSSNEDVLEIAGNNKLSPIEAGEVTVTATYKKKFSDSLTVTVLPQKALQPVTQPKEGEDYVLSMVPKSGTRNYAVGGMDGYYLKSGTELEDAAKARVVIDTTATDAYKYQITLTYTESEKEVTKTIAGCKTGTGTNTHINIGYYEDRSDAYPYEKQLFKLNEDLSLSTMIAGEEFWIGTYNTYYTFSFRSASQIQYKAQLFGYADPIHAQSITIDQESAKVKVGGIAKLSATLVPSNSTDIVTWYSKNQSVATVDSSTGLVIGKGEGTAEIVAKARPRKEASITVTVEGAVNYGTEAEPLTVQQAKASLDADFASGDMTPNEMYVTGTVSSATYSTQYKNWTIWLYDGTTAKGFELYATSLKEGLDSDLLKDGAIIKAHGLAKIMIGSSGNTYELTNKGSESAPVAYSLVPPELTSIALDPATVELNIHDGAQTQQFTVKPTPAAAVVPDECTWTVTPADAGATIANGLLSVADTAVAAGESKEFTVTATLADGKSATATVTVINDGGQAQLSEVYKLDGTKQQTDNDAHDGSNYAKSLPVTQGNVTWEVFANTTMNPWRIGGKNLTGTDRAVYSKSAVTSADVEKVVVSLGDMTVTSLNSVTLQVGSSEGASDVSEISLTTGLTANAELEFVRPADTSWASRYFKLVFNITVSVNSNKFVHLKGVSFLAAVA